MRLARHRALDPLCGEYLLGTLRGAARRRFERALREEPEVAARLAHWQRRAVLHPADAFALPMRRSELDRGWERLQLTLGLRRSASPWYERIGLWRGWAVAASAAAVALAFALALRLPEPSPEARLQAIAALGEAQRPGVVAVAASPDRALLRLEAARPIQAGTARSFELWVIPAGGGAPVSLAVLGDLSASVPLAPAHRPLLQPGSTLAVSVEPPAGSPTGAPTGPVILSGAVGG